MKAISKVRRTPCAANLRLCRTLVWLSSRFCLLFLRIFICSVLKSLKKKIVKLLNHETNGIEQIILQNLTSFFQAFHYRANKKNLKILKSKQISPGKVVFAGQDLHHGDLVAPPVVVLNTSIIQHRHLRSRVLRVRKAANPTLIIILLT